MNIKTDILREVFSESETVQNELNTFLVDSFPNNDHE